MIWLLGGYMWLFIHRPFEVWPWLGALHIERIYMLVAIGYWAIGVERAWISNRLNAAFGFFSIVVILSWLLSPYSSQGSQTVEDYFKVAVFYVMVMTTVREERDLKRLVAMFAVAVGLYMAHSLREYGCGRGMYRMGSRRMVGVDMTYCDPNTFAATVVYSLTMAWPLWAECRTKWHRLAVLGYVAMGVICVLLTGSRTGLAGLCCLAAIATILSKHRLKVALLLALAAPIIWNCLPQDRQNRFLTLIDPSYGPKNAQTSAESRSVFFHQAVNIWKENLLLGVGPAAFGTVAGHGMQAHTLYGQVLAELGTLGALALCYVVWAFFANALAIRGYSRAQPELRKTFPARLTAAVTLTVVLLLFFGFGGHNLYRYTWLWFGAFQAIALHCLKERAEAHASQEADWTFDPLAPAADGWGSSALPRGVPG
ncbi:MAG: O-antigen ligase family protein [Pirellulales bacterium]